MKLPDYLSCVEIQELFVSMGISEIPELRPVSLINKVQTITEVDVENPAIAFGNRLNIMSIPLNDAKVSIAIAKDQTIEVNGIKSCAYIKKQSNGIDVYHSTSTYRYHLCNCKTIQQMISDGRLSRYVATTRSDGLFPVIDQSNYSATERILRLELCKNCMDILDSRRMLPYPYSLKLFFEKYQPSIPETIRREEYVTTEERYAHDHPEVAKRYKKSVNYCCQICKVNCTNVQHCLHLHHKDGNGQNNNPSNLMVLCATCHVRQPKHEYMQRNPKFSQMINTIKNLREEQGILSLA